jgi:hypothetical protein
MYRSNPNLLAGWVSIINDAVACSDGLLEAHLASSVNLLRHAESERIQPWPLPSFSLLESSAFDRAAYMRDVCLGKGSSNETLTECLTSIRAAVDPDIVISWTENAYLKRVFQGATIVFMEFGPVPRTGFVDTIHIDPFGHQIGSVFDAFRDPHWNEGDENGAIAAWYDHWIKSIEATSEAIKLREWLATLPPGRTRKLIALQPDDWLTYEGTGIATDPISLLAARAAAAGADDVIIPQWHPAQVPPDEDLLEAVCREYPALAVPPEGLRVGYSESLLTQVDEVITVSSNVALAAALLGRRVDVLGQGKFSALSTVGDTPTPERRDLIPVIAAQLCRPLQDWTRKRGCFVNHLQSAIDWRDDLTSRPHFELRNVQQLLN